MWDDKKVYRCLEWVRNNVPLERRAGHERLLNTDTEIMLSLINKCIALEELQERFYRLQMETAKRNQALFPEWGVEVDSEIDIKWAWQRTSVRYEVKPFEIAIRQSSHSSHEGTDFEETRRALKNYFDKQVMTKLWSETEYTLFKTLNIEKTQKVT